MPTLESSYILSLTNQLGTSQDISDQMTSFLTEFECADEDVLVEKMGPFSKDDAPIKEVTEEFLSTFGEIIWPPNGSSKEQKLRWSTDKEK